MTREEALQALILLSALESWAFGLKASLPGYLHDQVAETMDVLRRVVLEKEQA